MKDEKLKTKAESLKNRRITYTVLRNTFVVVLCTLYFVLFSFPVLAATNNSACGILPCDIYTGFFQLGNLNEQILSFIRFGFSAVFVGIIIVGIFVIIRAALKIIRSEGDEKQIEEGYKAIKGVWIGIGMIFVGIIGLLLIFAFFRFDAGALDTNPSIPSL